MSEHLTAPNKHLAEQQANTPPGMAHWAGTGPKGKQCRECLFWTGCGGERGYYSGGNGLKPRSCKKYMDLMSGKRGPAVPYYTPACRHFAQSDKPPGVYK